MQSTAQVIPFRNQELLLVNNAGEAFVPMKPVVEGMGLDWKTQHRKLMSGRFEACMVEMTIQLPNDNQRRAVTCLPLRKLTGWLMSIHPNKVRPELRDGIIAYQNECDDVLWSYWNDGMAVRHDDRNINTLLGQTIGTDGFRCLGAVLEGKLVNIPKPDRKRIKHHIWSQVHKAFSVVSAQDIPASSMDAARNFIAAYAIDGEYLPKQDGIQLEPKPHARYLVSFNYKGEQRIDTLPGDVCVMSHQELIKAMVTPGELPVSTEDMFEFTMAALANLKMRSSSQAHRLKLATGN